MKIALILAALALAGCATPTTGIVPRDEGMFTLTRQGGSFLVSADSLKVEALKEASEFCGKKNAQLKLIHSKEIPAGAMGRWPESEILFRCI